VPKLARRKTALCRSAASRTTPPFPTRSRVSSNCGFTIATQSNSEATQASTAGSTLRSEMNDTSATTRSGRYGSESHSSDRAFTRSSTVTRGSPRSFQWSSP
jgi:hypothetical protein